MLQRIVNLKLRLVISRTHQVQNAIASHQWSMVPIQLLFIHHPLMEERAQERPNSFYVFPPILNRCPDDKRKYLGVGHTMAYFNIPNAHTHPHNHIGTSSVAHRRHIRILLHASIELCARLIIVGAHPHIMLSSPHREKWIPSLGATPKIPLLKDRQRAAAWK